MKILILALFLTGCESLNLKKPTTEEFVVVKDELHIIQAQVPNPPIKPIVGLEDERVKKLLQDF